MKKGERFNSISHLVGAALALAGTVVLVVVASKAGGAGLRSDRMETTWKWVNSSIIRRKSG